MKNLFLIDGASGTGKSDLVRYALDFADDVGLVQKYTTRPERDYENKAEWQLDLKVIDEEAFPSAGLDYTYTYGRKKYGFYRDDLLAALRDHANVFLIVRSTKIIGQLQKEFRFINVVPVYIYTDLDRVRARLANQQFTPDEIEFRVSRHEMAWEDYSKRPDLYREVIINNSSIENYHRLIDLMLIKRYTDEPDIDESMVFLLMSLKDDPEHRDYAEAVKRAVRTYSADLRCLNLDDVHRGAYEITPEAKSQIRHARLAIIDITDNRPNVYYELGFVHGISKDHILTCHTRTKPHFYPAGQRILFYKGSTELEEKIATELPGVFGNTI